MGSSECIRYLIDGKCALFGEPLLEIEKVKERTDQITNKLGEIDESVNILDFSISPIAVLYFLIRQQRSLCEIEENIKACDLMQKVKYRIWESPHRDTTMKELYYCGMPLNEVEDFIDMETELLAVCIYGGSKLSDEEWTKRMRNIRYRKKQVHKLLSFLTTEIPLSEVSILHILACLQLLLSDEFSEDNEINDGDIKKQKRHKISGVLCNDNDYVLSPDKMYWIKMIDNYVYLNTDRIDVQSKYMDFLLIFYSIKKKIHSAKNINRMQNIHEIYYKALADFIFRNI